MVSSAARPQEVLDEPERRWTDSLSDGSGGEGPVTRPRTAGAVCNPHINALSVNTVNNSAAK